MCWIVIVAIGVTKGLPYLSFKRAPRHWDSVFCLCFENPWQTTLSWAQFARRESLQFFRFYQISFLKDIQMDNPEHRQRPLCVLQSRHRPIRSCVDWIYKWTAGSVLNELSNLDDRSQHLKSLTLSKNAAGEDNVEVMIPWSNFRKTLGKVEI